MSDLQLIIAAIVILLLAGWISVKITTTVMKLVLFAIVAVVLITMYRDKLPF